MALSVLPLSSRAMVAHLFPNLACARMIFSSSSCVKGRCSTCGDSWLHQRRRHDFPDLPGTCLLMSDQFLGPCFCTSFFKASASPDQTAGRSPLWALGVRVAVGRSRKEEEGGPEMETTPQLQYFLHLEIRSTNAARDATTAIACRLAFGETARPDPLTAGGPKIWGTGAKKKTNASTGEIPLRTAFFNNIHFDSEPKRLPRDSGRVVTAATWACHFSGSNNPPPPAPNLVRVCLTRTSHVSRPLWQTSPFLVHVSFYIEDICRPPPCPPVR
ncbi:unnamed protein product [Spirodela intermedia]|uniref:Uncharacterized protein n=1 Tax=Spirodela intermedia TaxID=51605 RepID=A0A7I8LDD6_SPIIN|nr:unnamed protein product [Spirodela intermedia]